MQLFRRKINFRLVSSAVTGIITVLGKITVLKGSNVVETYVVHIRESREILHSVSPFHPNSFVHILESLAKIQMEI